MTDTIIFLVVLLVFSAFFSGTEIAYTSVNKLRLESLAENGKKSASRAMRIIENFSRALGTILVGNNIVNITISTVSTMLVTDLLKGDTTRAVPIVTGIVTLFILIFGEILPKTLAKRFSLVLSCAVSLPLRIIMIILSPVSAPFNAIARVVVRRWTKKEDKLPTVTEEELSGIIETVEEEGIIDEDKGDLLQSALEFSDISVGEILTPRIEMTAIDINADIEETIQVALTSPFSRLPVYDGDVDHIIGVLYVNRLLKRVAAKKEFNLRDILFEPCFFHKTMKLPVVLSEMRRLHIHIAVVIDEYGGTMGVVTMEDILEEIVGDIWDESDEIKVDFVEKSEGNYEVNGSANIYDFLEFIDVDSRDFESEYTTVGGWIVEMLQANPAEGDSFDYKNIYVIVTEVKDNIVNKATVVIKQDQPEEE